MLDASGLLSDMKAMGIEFEVCNHSPVFTMKESGGLDLQLQGERCKNLFLRDKKDRKFLIVTLADKLINLNDLRGILGVARLSLASSEQLFELLGVKPGSLTPFAIINDSRHEVKLVIDTALLECDFLLLHPLNNEMTIQITINSLSEYLQRQGCDITWSKLGA